MSKFASLLKPVQLGNLHLKNSLVVAPLTRMRGESDGTPTDLMNQYYTQRHQYGLILTECSQISNLSLCFPGSGGIYTDNHVEGWKKITDKIHEKGSLIMMQIWHCGRAVSPTQINGQQPIAPSPIAIRGLNYVSKEQHVKPRELTTQEVKEVVQQYKQAAINAKKAGFDGVEIHGANGYLVDQFLRDGSNQRTDEYGGSIQNRCRFTLEIIDECINVFGSGRVAIRISPTGRYNDMYDSNPLELCKYLLGELDKRNLAFVELKRHGSLEKMDQSGGEKAEPSAQIPDFFNQLRQFYKGNIIANDGITLDEAESLVSSGIAQAVSFGKLSIANPDLPNRVLKGYEINQTVDVATWYAGGPKGYTDYPVIEQN